MMVLHESWAVAIPIWVKWRTAKNPARVVHANRINAGETTGRNTKSDCAFNVSQFAEKPRGARRIGVDWGRFAHRLFAVQTVEMRCVVQRVREARVTIDDRCVGEIGCGLLVLAAVEVGDGDAERAWMAEKLVHLRIFPDADGKMNRSVLDVGDSAGAAGILLISNFTVAGECSKGRRPGFDRAMKPPEAKREFDQFLAAVRSLGAPHGVRVETGEFGADMQVSLVNDGPVTLVIESPRRGTLAG